MKLKFAACSVLMLSCAVAHAGEDPCRAGLHGWSIGGFPFREEASSLMKYVQHEGVCPENLEHSRIVGNCRAVAPDGFTYRLFYGVKKDNEAWVWDKERLVKPQEQLPFGIVPGDSAAVALKKTGGLGGYVHQGHQLWAVEVECGPKVPRFIGEGPPDYYDLDFVVGDDGNVIGVSETDQDQSGTRY
jgi:hypothetical protein